MLLSALGSHREPGLLIGAARGGFTIGVWGLSPEGFSGTGEGGRYSTSPYNASDDAPYDRLKPIQWERCYTVRDSPKSGGSAQLMRHSDLMPRKHSLHFADFRTVINGWLSAGLASFRPEKERRVSCHFKTKPR